MIPVARTNDLITTDHEEGLVVYDTIDNRAHSLNGVSAFVWLESDGVNKVEDIAAHLGVKLGSPDKAEMRALVLLAVSQLRQNGLVLPEVKQATESVVSGAMTRRAAAAAIGKAALLVGGVMPMVYSLVAPEPAFAQSGHVPPGECQTLPGGICQPVTCTRTCLQVPVIPPPPPPADPFTCICG